jgi:hypothetical protein
MANLMAQGNLLETTAGCLGMSLEEFETRVQENKENARVYEIGKTMLIGYYQERMRVWMLQPPRNNEIMKVFLSHYMKIVERKPVTEMKLEQTGPSHEENLKQLQGE